MNIQSTAPSNLRLLLYFAERKKKWYLQSCFPNILADQLNCFSPQRLIVSVPAAITQALLPQILMCILFKQRVPMSSPKPCAALGVGGDPGGVSQVGGDWGAARALISTKTRQLYFNVVQILTRPKGCGGVTLT